MQLNVVTRYTGCTVCDLPSRVKALPQIMILWFTEQSHYITIYNIGLKHYIATNYSGLCVYIQCTFFLAELQLAGCYIREPTSTNSKSLRQ